MILTTRTHWKKDPTAELNALMSARRQDIVQVRFRPESPQFSATVHLEALADPDAAEGFVSALREIAAGASATASKLRPNKLKANRPKPGLERTMW